MEDLLPDFLTETLESLEKLDIELVKLERQPDDKPALSSIFRHVHTIKGTCGFLGLSRLEKVAHAAESVLDQHRNGAMAVTPASITLILRALDTIRVIVDGISQIGKEPDGDDGLLIGELIGMAEGHAGPTAVTTNDEEMELPAVAVVPVPAPILTASIPAIPLRKTEVASSAEPSAQAAMQTIRVNVDVLEDLMTLVSEL